MRYGKFLVKSANSGNIDRAIEIFKKATEFDDQNYKAFYHLGLAYMEKNSYKKANEAFKESLKINHSFVDGWKAVGHLLFEKNHYSTAIKYFEQALTCDPKDLEAKFGLANCFLELQVYSL